MAENIVTNSDDVELTITPKAEDAAGYDGGTIRAGARITVDDFTLTNEEDNSLVGSVSTRIPSITKGDKTASWSFTMMGSDKDLFDAVAKPNGDFRLVEITARKPQEADGGEAFEYALNVAIPTSEEVSLSTGDAMEYAVEGIGQPPERL